MSTATVSSKGQITLPLEVRLALHVDAGDRVEFVEVGPGRYEDDTVLALTADFTQDFHR